MCVSQTHNACSTRKYSTSVETGKIHFRIEATAGLSLLYCRVSHANKTSMYAYVPKSQENTAPGIILPWQPPFSLMLRCETIQHKTVEYSNQLALYPVAIVV